MPNLKKKAVATEPAAAGAGNRLPSAAMASQAVAVFSGRPAAGAVKCADVGPRFLFVFNPSRWTVATVDGQDLPVPSLTRQPVVGGSNGITVREDQTTGEDVVDFSKFFARMQKLGRTLIPDDWCHASDTPDGRPGYVRRTKVKNGWVHHTPWEWLEVIGDEAVLRGDPAGFWRWVAALVQRGRLPQVSSIVLERMRDIHQKGLDGASLREGAAAYRIAKRHEQAIERIDNVIPLAAPSAAVASGLPDDGVDGGAPSVDPADSDLDEVL